MTKNSNSFSSNNSEMVSSLSHLAETGLHINSDNPDMGLPSAEKIIDIVEGLKAIFYPGYYGDSSVHPHKTKEHINATLAQVSAELEEQIRLGYSFVSEKPVEVMSQFLDRLPAMKKLLDLDVQASYEGDPAARTHGEVLFCYPGFQAILHYRIAHELYRLGVPVIPRIVTENAHSKTGIDIHPGAEIDESFFIDHGNGVVIGETAIVGKRVRIYQGVTLGAKSFPLDEQGNPIKGVPRHPIIEDDVIIYSGATLLGRITIGEASVIGGNVWLTHSAPAKSHITQAGLKKGSFSGGAGI